MVKHAESLAVGCAMWANRDWIGTYLPIDTPAGTELSSYSRICGAVEGNTTFYATPPESTVRRWAESVTGDFRFVFKLPREVTHDRRLRDVEREVRTFLDAIRPLQGAMGPISIQLPASFAPGDLPTLLLFLDSVRDDFAWAVEVRHRDFHAGGDTAGGDNERALNDALHDRGVDRVIFDSRAMFAGPCETEEEHRAFSEKPHLSVRGVATGAQPIVRFIGQRDIETNREFWAPWVDRIVRWRSTGKRPIVFLHTADNVDAPAHARAFYEDCRRADPSIEPLSPLTGLAAQSSLEL